MAKSIELPTHVRFMSGREYALVSGVFLNTLPWRVRILITNAAGTDGRPFTIPTSLISSVLGVPVSGFFAGVALGYLASAINLAYLINVGDAYSTLTTSDQDTLVHETAHVWQGHNSRFALSYVFNSVYNQCKSAKSAYSYSAGMPWQSYNVEQQASIVEDWHMSGRPSSGPLWPYITDHVRKGDA